MNNGNVIMFIFIVIDIFGWKTKIKRIILLSNSGTNQLKHMSHPVLERGLYCIENRHLHEADVCQDPEQLHYNVILFSRLPQKAVNPADVSLYTSLSYVNSSQTCTS